MPAQLSGDTRTEDRGATALLGLLLLLALTAAGLLATAGPPRPPAGLPSAAALLAALRGSAPPLRALGYLAAAVAWLCWLWLAGSLAIELLLAAAEAAAGGATWLRACRALADRVTAPLARRAVAAAFVVQVVGRSVPLASAAPEPPEPPALVVADERGPAEVAAPVAPNRGAATSLEYRVRGGDTLWDIALRFYGSGTQYRRLIDANLGRQMADGRRFTRQAVIHPGWVLTVPLGGDAVEREAGTRWYTVAPGDTLRGIAARELGDEQQWQALYDLNQGPVTGPDGRTLASPDLIWPGIRLRLPPQEQGAPEAPEPDPPVAAVTAELAPARSQPLEPPSPAPATPVAPPTVVAAPSQRDPAEAAVAPEAGRQDAQVPPDDVGPDAAEVPAPTPTLAPAPERPALTWLAPATDQALPADDRLSPIPALGGLGLAALGAGAAVWGARRLRRPRRAKIEPESDVVVEGGFATADLTQDLAHRLHGDEADPVPVVATLLGRFLAEQRLETVSVVAARHGRSATTLTLAVPIADQARLLQVATTFGQRIGVSAETWLSPDHDVLLRLSGLRRARLLAPSDSTAQATPWLLPIGVLFSRQILYVDWHALGHVLVAGVQGQGADTILTSLLATLTARHRPEDLRLLTIAAPRTLPAPIGELPHQSAAAGTLVDPADTAAVAAAIEDVRAVVEARLERASSQALGREPDLALVVGELADLNDHMGSLEFIGTHGPAHGVRLLAATSDPNGLRSPILPHFTTRLVLQTEDEDASMALLGLNDAAFLGGGGRLLLRIDAREPVELYGYRVAAEHLERLVRLMGEAYGTGAPQPLVARPRAPTEPALPPTAPERLDADGEPVASPSAGGPDNGDWHVAVPAAPRAAEVAGPDREQPPAGEEALAVDRPPAPLVAVPDPNGRPQDVPPRPSPADPPVVRGPEPEALQAAAVAKAPAPPTAPPGADAGASGPVQATGAQRMERIPTGPTAQAAAAEPPLTVVCFGGPRVLHRGRQIWPTSSLGDAKPWEVLVFLACQPAEGVTREALAQALWPDDTRATDPAHRLRQLRYRLRNALEKLAPGVPADLVRPDASGVYRLDPTLVSSDAQRFLALYRIGRTSCGARAIAAYEEARLLYTGDLLEGPDARRYAWVDDRDDSGVMLQEHFRGVHHQLSRSLADLYASAGQTDAALGLYHELAEADPGDESIWRALFRLHHQRRDRPALLREERRLRQALREVDPDDDAVADPEVYEPSAETVFEFDRLLADLGGRQAARAERPAAVMNGVAADGRR